MRTFLTSIICIIGLIFHVDGQIIFHQVIDTETNDRLKSMRSAESGYFLIGNRLSYVSVSGDELLSIDAIAKGGALLSADNGFVTATNSYSGQSTASIGHVVRYDTDGNEVWAKDVQDGVWRNFVNDVIPLSDGGFVYTGRHATVAGSGAILRGIDSLGNHRWESRWNSGEWVSTHGQQIFKKKDYLFVIGVANAGNFGYGVNRDMFVSKHDMSSGLLLNDVLVSSDTNLDPSDLFISSDSVVFLLGTSQADSANPTSMGLLSKIDLSETILWTKKYPSQNNEVFQGIESTDDNEYLILGNRIFNDGDSILTFIKKIDPSGEERWEYIFESPELIYQGIEIVRENNTEYVVSGHQGNADDTDYFLTKFDITNLGYVGREEIDQVDPLEVIIYPNPTTDIIQIELKHKNSSSFEFKFFNVTGVLVDHYLINSGHFTYSLAGLSRGMYFVSIKNGDDIVVRKITIW